MQIPGLNDEASTSSAAPSEIVRTVAITSKKLSKAGAVVLTGALCIYCCKIPDFTLSYSSGFLQGAFLGSMGIFDIWKTYRGREKRNESLLGC